MKDLANAQDLIDNYKKEEARKTGLVPSDRRVTAEGTTPSGTLKVITSAS